MAATPPPWPVPRGMWVLIWLGVDSFRLTYSSWPSQVSVRQNKSIWYSDIKSFSNTSLDDRDLMFKSLHLILLFCCAISAFLFRFLCITPLLLTFGFINLSGRGTHTVTKEFWVGKCSGSAEKRVGLQLCLLVSTLSCHGEISRWICLHQAEFKMKQIHTFYHKMQ